jgi:hypothetical protein
MVAMVATLGSVAAGCNITGSSRCDDPHLVGDRGNLRFWIGGVCPWSAARCTPDCGLYLDGDLVGYRSMVAAGANSNEFYVPLPDLEFSSSRDHVFTVRAVWCRPVGESPEDPLLPCPVDDPYLYAIDLDLHSDGTADLLAHRTDDGSLYDRGTVRVRPPLCQGDSRDARCPD